MLVVALVGCWWAWPTETSESGFLGRVTDAAGAPVVGLKVENLESSEKTDGDGVFGLYHKPPDQHVMFTHAGGLYRRGYLPTDEGTRVEIGLPEVSPAALSCGDFTCRAQLTWTLGPAYSVRHTVRCTPGLSVDLEGVPAGVPDEVVCKAKVTDPALPATVVRSPGGLTLQAP